MLSPRGLASWALTALIFCGSSTAAPRPGVEVQYNRRQAQNQASNGNATAAGNSTSLEPVIPPNVNQDALSTLALATNITLAWAGSTAGPSNRRMVKRDNGVFTQAAFKFRYPTVPLDHSSFVSNVACPSVGTLTAVLTDAAYTYAKQQWTGAKDILFVTSADGCGMDNANDMFHATTVTFSDKDKSFTAKGSSAGYKQAASHMNLKWGDVGTLKLKRAVDKRDMFDPHALHVRASASLSVSWSAYLDNLIGVDNDAPWGHAALLAKWGKEGGEADDSYKKGEVASANGHHKRSTNESETALASLAMRELDERDASYGLALYCVECGFGGSAELWGEIDVDIGLFSLDVNTVQAGFNANFKAGLNLGMQAFVKYEKEWEKELDRIPLDGFDIPLLVDIGPFVSVSIKATAGIEASGTLLIGAAVAWDNIDIMLDVLNPSNSHMNGLTPRFEHKAEAGGEVKVSASLGLPVKLGLGVDILDGLWEADAAIVDTPSIVAEGKFEVSATVTDDGHIEYDINGGCYGIAWDVHFENTLEAVLEGDDIGSVHYNLIDPQESEPIAEGCIGYVNDGTDDDDAGVNPDGTGSSTGQVGNGMNSAGNGMSGGKGSPGNGAPVVIGASISSVRSSSAQASTASSKPASTGPSAAATSSAKPSTSVKPSTTTVKSSTSTSIKPTCTPSQVIVNPKVPSGLSCKKIVAQASVADKYNVGKKTDVANADACAAACLKNSQCVSFGLLDSKSCQLYSKAVKSIGVVTKKGSPQVMFYDKDCYAYSTCPK